MNAIALICEFNPFHNGHLALIKEIKKKFPQRPLICFMSTEYVQRGELAIIPAKLRAKAAVLCGADAVFGLPISVTLAPAQIYAKASIELIEKTNMASTLVFGSESGEIADLRLACERMKNKEFVELFDKYIADKMPYPIARTTAYNNIYGDNKILMLPNNMLAVEYLNYVNKLEAVTFKRINGENICSANDIRNNFTLAERNMPKASYDIFSEAITNGQTRNVKYIERHILMELSELQNEYADCPKGFSARIKSCATASKDLSDYYENLSVKQYTSSRLRRLTLCSVLKINSSEWSEKPPYIKLYAAKEDSTKVISSSQIPILVKPSSAIKISENAQKFLQRETSREQLAFMSQKNITPLDDAYRFTPYID